MRRAVVGVLLACCLAVTAGCGGRSNDTTLTVFAAASLTGTFDTLASTFEHDHPGVKVRVSYGSSTTLAQQITAGAPADVIATADQQSISLVVKAGDLAGTPHEFATNRLVIVTPPGNPGHVHTLADLAQTSYAVCIKTAPCGGAAATVLQRARITHQPATYAADVKATLNEVVLNQVDAALVYDTDALAARGQVATIPIPAASNVVNPYYIGAVSTASEPKLAQQWLALVESPAGRKVLTAAGFAKS
ncbi:MAG: molybdate ABC transporter substrate-binding protein [Sciscionella sp.]